MCVHCSDCTARQAELARHLRTQTLHPTPEQTFPTLVYGCARRRLGSISLLNLPRDAFTLVNVNTYRGRGRERERGHGREQREKNVCDRGLLLGCSMLQVFLAANAKKEGVVTLGSGLQFKVLKSGAKDAAVAGRRYAV
jgi:hypothetical protein